MTFYEIPDEIFWMRAYEHNNLEVPLTQFLLMLHQPVKFHNKIPNSTPD